MDVFQGMSDDQTAMIGCVVALIVCGGILSLSTVVGRLFHGSQESTPEPTEPAILKHPSFQHAAKSADNDDQSFRRAA